MIDRILKAIAALIVALAVFAISATVTTAGPILADSYAATRVLPAGRTVPLASMHRTDTLVVDAFRVGRGRGVVRGVNAFDLLLYHRGAHAYVRTPRGYGVATARQVGRRAATIRYHVRRAWRPVGRSVALSDAKAPPAWARILPPGGAAQAPAWAQDVHAYRPNGAALGRTFVRGAVARWGRVYHARGRFVNRGAAPALVAAWRS